MLVAARWIHFASLSIVVGSEAFLLFISGLASTDLPSRLLRAASIVAATSGAAWLGGTIANVAGPEALLDPVLLRVFFIDTPFGAPFAVRMALLGALVVIASLPLRPSLSRPALLSLGSMLLVEQAWLGHAAQGGRYGSAMVFAYATHVLAAATWAGSLPALSLATWQARDKGAKTPAILKRYSVLAVPCVVLVVVSGTANTLFHATSTKALFASTYGHVLATKLVLVAAMLVLAAFVRWFLAPRVRHDGAAQGTGWTAAVIATEGILALLVVGAAALLGLTPPPR